MPPTDLLLVRSLWEGASGGQHNLEPGGGSPLCVRPSLERCAYCNKLCDVRFDVYRRQSLSDGWELSHNSRPPLLESSFRRRLIAAILRKAQQALDMEDADTRAFFLQDFFKDIALEVDHRAEGLLYGADSQSALSRVPLPLCYYEVLAEHYEGTREDAARLLPLCVQLWTQSLVPSIFALLLHRYIFSLREGETSELDTVKYINVCLAGACSLFWLDLKSNCTQFVALFRFLLHEVALVPERLQCLPPSPKRELVSLVARFFLLYEDGCSLRAAVDHLPGPLALGLEARGTPMDLFVHETVRQLKEIKVEPVLVRYLEASRHFAGATLRTTTSIRLQALLYGLSTPGGPLYPPLSVRAAANVALDTLFPVGRRLRQVIRTLFRLLHPYYLGSAVLALAREWSTSFRHSASLFGWNAGNLWRGFACRPPVTG